MNIEKKDMHMKTNQYISIKRYSGSVSKPHIHEFLEMAYVLKGKALHKFNGREEQLISPGDYFFIDYKTVHSYKSIGEDDLCLINCLFLPELIDKSLVYCKDFQTLLRHYLLQISGEYSKLNLADRIFSDQNGKILNILNQMLEEYESDNLLKTELLRIKMMEVLITTAQTLSAAPSGDIISAITDGIHKRYNENLTLGALTKDLNYSLPYLSKLFKEKTGLNFRAYLHKVRCEEACRLLANTDEKIQNISRLVGYSDADFFSKIFKSNLKTTPGAFRKQIKGAKIF